MTGGDSGPRRRTGSQACRQETQNQQEAGSKAVSQPRPSGRFALRAGRDWLGRTISPGGRRPQVARLGAVFPPSRLVPVDRRDEPIASPRKCLDESRRSGRVPEDLPQPLDGRVQAVLEVHKGVVGPEFVSKRLPCDERAVLTDENRQQAERLIRQEHRVHTVPLELARTQVQDELPKADDVGSRRRLCHQCLGS